jgi:hypothetical protein
MTAPQQQPSHAGQQGAHRAASEPTSEWRIGVSEAGTPGKWLLVVLHRIAFFLFVGAGPWFHGLYSRPFSSLYPALPRSCGGAAKSTSKPAENTAALSA